LDFILLLVSLISGAIIGHAASMQEKSLGPFLNIVTGVIGGGLGWIMLKGLGWYSAGNVPGWQISALLGYMVISCVTGGLLIIIAAFFKYMVGK
jgi:hypothetical protein